MAARMPSPLPTFLFLVSLRSLSCLSLNGSHVSLLQIPPGYEPLTYPDPERDNGGRPTIVDIIFVVEDILEVNDQTFSMTVEVKILMSWRDRRLKLKPEVVAAHEARKEALSLEHLVLEEGEERESVWTPNFSIAHLIEFTRLETLRRSDVLVAVPGGDGGDGDFAFSHEGIYVVKLKCPMDFNAFPFDSHDCFFEAFIEKPSSVVSLHSPSGEEEKDEEDVGLVDFADWGWAATTTTIEYETTFAGLPRERLVRTVRSAHAHAGGVSGGVGTGAGMNVTIAGFRVRLVRKVNYFIFNYFVPSGMFVVISWVSFIIPPESVPGRIALIITTLLVLINISNTVFAVSPAADSINDLQLWVLVCFTFVSVTVVEYSVVLFLMRQRRRRRQRKALAARPLDPQVTLVAATIPKSPSSTHSPAVAAAAAAADLEGKLPSRSGRQGQQQQELGWFPATFHNARSLMSNVFGGGHGGGGGGGDFCGEGGGGGTDDDEEEVEGNAKLQVVIANIDYACLVLTFIFFVAFNFVFWFLH